MVAATKEVQGSKPVEVEKTVAYKISQRDELTEKTGHYWGIKEFTLKDSI